ncbi:unnamed protein product [Rotaria socialis]|uniref:Uncharacterized protein n=1 Tax=Rotaria socialis TaxID=392032 RepID=A0A817U872_9BILA|nr:unnamed protein product [Rotaria socialis]
MSLSNISANEIDAFGEILATFVTICCYLMIILGLISHSLSIVVFTRRSLRSNPYSCYFLAATLNGVYVVTMNMLLWPLQVIRDRDISFLFADSARQKSNTVGILFTIEIDLSISTIPYASLKDISYYSKKQNAEEEILFSMHTIYQIGHIKQIDNNFWEVNLVLTNGNDVQLKLLTAHAREELGGTDEKHALVPLLFKMGELKKAEEIAFALIQSTSELNLNDTMYYSFFYLGQVKYAVGDYSTALSYFEKAISIAEIFFSSYHSTLAVFYNDIGLCYNSTDNHSAALLYYEKALNIQENHPISNHSHLAATYMNTALAYVSMGDYAKALSFYEKAKTMQEEILPPIHPDLATCYNNISKTYSSKGQYKVALSFSEKVRHIREKNLPSNHYSLSSCYDQIALIYEKMGEYSTALLFYEKALNITQKLVPKNYHDIGTQYNNIGMTYYEMKDYSMALSYYKKKLFKIINNLILKSLRAWLQLTTIWV